MKTRNRILGRIFLLFFVTALYCHSAYSQEWLKEVKHALDLGARVSGENQIALTSYRHIGAVGAEKEKRAVLDEIFAEDAVTAISSGAACSIVEWGDYHAFTSEVRERFKMRVFSAIAMKDVEIVELDWLYRGRNYKSKALVCDEGIVYDNIASFAIDNSAMSVKKETSVKLTRPIPDEWAELLPFSIVSDKRGATFVMNEYADGMLLLTGKYAWRYKSRFISVFDSNGILCNESSRSGCESEIGWQCNLAAEFTAGELMKSKYREYTLKCDYGDRRGGITGFSRIAIQRP